MAKRNYPDRETRLITKINKNTPVNTSSATGTYDLPNYSGVNKTLNEGRQQGGQVDWQYFLMSTGAGNGKVLMSDASGNGTWTTL